MNDAPPRFNREEIAAELGDGWLADIDAHTEHEANARTADFLDDLAASYRNKPISPATLHSMATLIRGAL